MATRDLLRPFRERDTLDHCADHRFLEDVLLYVLEVCISDTFMNFLLISVWSIFLDGAHEAICKLIQFLFAFRSELVVGDLRLYDYCFLVN